LVGEAVYAFTALAAAAFSSATAALSSESTSLRGEARQGRCASKQAGGHALDGASRQQ
jgi:hypothetical protein